jgi:hypothetical protein
VCKVPHLVSIFPREFDKSFTKMERRFVAPLLAAAAFLLLLAFASASSDDIAGCGGFVRLSKELQRCAPHLPRPVSFVFFLYPAISLHFYITIGRLI